MPDACDIVYDMILEEEKLEEDRRKLQEYKNKFYIDLQDLFKKSLNDLYDDGMTDSDSIFARKLINTVNTYASKLHD